MTTRTILLWIVAFAITVASAVYQRLTGPTYPVAGTYTHAGIAATYRFDRSHEGETDHVVRVSIPDTAVAGVLQWKRLRSDSDWSRVPMTRSGEFLTGALPGQPPAGKLVYCVVLDGTGGTAVIPAGDPVVIRFKGAVPLWVLIPHILVMFLGMLLSTRAGLEVASAQPSPRRYVPWILGFLAFGGFVLGPLLQKYAFDLWWTGWPFGNDITDNKTAAAFLAWVGAAVALKKSRYPIRWVVVAACVTLLVYLIPHSIFGTELDYSTMQKR